MAAETWAYAQERDEFVRWFIAEMMAHGKRDGVDIFDVVKAENQVELLFNGCSLSFSKTIKFLGEQLDDLVTKKAQDLVREKFDGITAALDDVKHRVVDHMTSLLDAHGVPKSEDQR